jgi:hypothetical protein
MASPSAVPCPEPIPYSSNNSYADIDFTEPPMDVFTAQPKFVDVDSILADQLGPVTNPVTTNAQPELSGSPVLPKVNQSNAAPVGDGSKGADINNSYTLINNEVEVAPVVPAVSTVPTVPTVPFVNAPSESFSNFNMPQLPPPMNMNYPMHPPIVHNVNPPPMMDDPNIAKFINSRNSEHFQNKEHFSHGKTILDNVVLFVIIVVGVYYLYSVSPYYKPLNVDLSKVPLIGSLADTNVSDNNKLMIVAGILIAVIVISRLLQ